MSASEWITVREADGYDVQAEYRLTGRAKVKPEKRSRHDRWIYNACLQHYIKEIKSLGAEND